MAKVFLSYDHEDAALARRIAAALEKAGHTVWYDRHIHGGAQYSHKIEQALGAADAVMVLWSPRSLDSAWVRDEAAEGRDRGKLVPLSIAGVTAPMGFRQFQTIDLGDWKGRGRVPRLADMLEAIASQAQGMPAAPTVSEAGSIPPPRSGSRRTWLLLALAAALVAAIGVGLWTWLDRASGPPTVSVAAADQSALSQALARSLLVKLGSLQSGSANLIELVERGSRTKSADLVITVGGSQHGGRPRATVSLTSAREGLMLWSKDFASGAPSQSDLEEQIAFSTARVLGCAIEESSGRNGRLNQRVRRLYLNGCAFYAELGSDKRPVIATFRQVVRHSPGFRPAWALLLMAEADALSFVRTGATATDPIAAQLRKDIVEARRVDPDMAEATIAALELNPGLPIRDTAAQIEKARSQDPDNPDVLANRAGLMLRVGRMNEAITDAERAAQLDPLSPRARTSYIHALAYGGRIDRAREELERAKQLWPGTQTIADTEGALELRFGDFETMVRRAPGGYGALRELYLKARKDPSDANVAIFIEGIVRSGLDAPRVAFLTQALGEMGRVDEFYDFLSEPRFARMLQVESYVLFRPWLDKQRRDPRFMALAARLGLVDYWRSSGHWPDYCNEPDLPYDCKAEAAKHG